jgi:hypothetical protein
MRGINLKLPYPDSNFDKPSRKTDQIVDQTFLSFSIDQEVNLETKNSTNILRSFSAIGHEMSEQRIPLEHYLRLEEESKEKTLIIKELQSSNNELKQLIKQIQEEK